MQGAAHLSHIRENKLDQASTHSLAYETQHQDKQQKMKNPTWTLSLPVLLSIIVVAVSDSSGQVYAKNFVRTRRRTNKINSNNTNNTDVNPDIVGGTTQPTAIPYFVKLEGGAVCGAALISTDIVLTAAHCVESKVGGFPSLVRIAPTTSSDGLGVPVDTSKSAVHPRWNGNVANGFDGT